MKDGDDVVTIIVAITIIVVAISVIVSVEIEAFLASYPEPKLVSLQLQDVPKARIRHVPHTWEGM